jgi:hypothetical protein
MLASYLVLAAIRPEKNFVLLGTGLATIVGCLLWRRVRGPGSSPSPRRLIALGTLVVLGFGLALPTRSEPSRPNRRMPASEWVLHHRIIYPHLTSVRAELPEDLERRFPPRVARRYDADPLGPRKVIARVARGAEDRARITRRLAAIVVRERWGTIALDVVSDTVENLVATLSFYGRLGALTVADEETSAKLERLDGSVYTYAKLSEAAPGLSRAHLAVSALLLVTGSVAWIRETRARRGAASSPERRAASLAWLPTAAFCLTNALAFSLSANLVHIRYTIFAHVVFLAFVYSALVGWALAPVAEMPRPSEAD